MVHRPTKNSDSTSSEDEFADNDDEQGEEESGPAIQSARSHDLGRTVFYPDLHVTNNEHWTMTPEAHKYAAAAGSFCFVTTENGEQLDVCNLTTTPCVHRSLCLDEVMNDYSSAQVEVPGPPVEKQQEQARARKEASAQEVGGYYKQFAEAKHLESKSWIDNEVFDLVDLRKFKTKNYVTGRSVLTSKTDKQGNFLRTKGRWVNRFPCFKKARISD